MRAIIFVLFLSCLCLAYMDIVLLKDAAINEGAVCLDGSPAAYFFKAGSEVNKTKWILHLLGGGFCMSPEECYLRSQMILGSSKVWPPIMLYGGPISENETYNPDFYDWNHAFFLYCDGGLFSGEREDPVVYNGETLYLRGHRNLLAIMKDLLQNKGLDKATDVFVVGDSAGGMSTFIHIEEIRSMMPSTVKRFKASPFSGVFLDYPNAEGKMIFGQNLEIVYKLHNSTSNQRCLSSVPSAMRYKCLFAENLMNFIDTPLFVINSAYDSIATSCIVGSEPALGPSKTGAGNCSAVPGWAQCENNSALCTKEEWLKVEAYGNTFMTTIENHPKFDQAGNGLFECNCHSHSMEAGDAWYVYTVQGTVMRDAVRAWYFSNNDPSYKHMYKGCVNHDSYNCNPCCSIPIH